MPASPTTSIAPPRPLAAAAASAPNSRNSDCRATKRIQTPSRCRLRRNLNVGHARQRLVRAASPGSRAMLWALTWPLRGEPDGTYQRGDTKRWLQYIRVDAEVAGVAVWLRIRL